MSEQIAKLEAQLNDFDPQRRREALEALLQMVADGKAGFPEPRRFVNLHGHTFFSYNGYGFSPTYFAWRARREGLLAAGVVDFDVLDAVDEFLEAGRMLGLRTCAGIETRVFVEAFADKVINSPGEPGIAYYMGSGFTSQASADSGVLDELKSIAQRRNLGMIERVNPFLDPVQIDYEKDVLPLTPAGNPTERHLCVAYDNKARAHFGDLGQTAVFWAEKLGVSADQARKALDSPPEIQGLIRSKTMKAGGVGYVKPEGPDFPRLERVAEFSLAAGAIPTFTWLDGTSEGEQEIERLLDIAMEAGTAAVNIIPDRNWNIKDPEQKKVKVEEFTKFVALSNERELPILVGTEMNAYGQLFVDDFGAPEMRNHVDSFIRGAQILYAHTALQMAAGMGYLSPWAKSRFASVRGKNDFFVRLGETLDPAKPERIANVSDAMTPDEVLAAAASEDSASGES